jgi:diadenosine tetraphosphatase ApaH/serine/threonine PP2A family protein phosphatase
LLLGYSPLVRILVVADVHSNLEAFQAVLAAACAGGELDAVWSLGDLVGYGADPHACIETLRSLAHVAIAGNHDLAAIGEVGTEDFNPYAEAAARWTAAQLTGEERDWIAGQARVLVQEEFTLVHGSLVDPVWEYLVSPSDAAAHLALQTTPYGLIGHSHIRMLYAEDGRGVRSQPPPEEGSIVLDGTRFVANPGGAGQPRDGDPRAAFAILDTEARRIHFHRVDYDIATAQMKIRAAGLPPFLAERLSRGR